MRELIVLLDGDVVVRPGIVDDLRRRQVSGRCDLLAVDDALHSLPGSEVRVPLLTPQAGFLTMVVSPATARLARLWHSVETTMQLKEQPSLSLALVLQRYLDEGQPVRTCRLPPAHYPSPALLFRDRSGRKHADSGTARVGSRYTLPLTNVLSAHPAVGNKANKFSLLADAQLIFFNTTRLMAPNPTLQCTGDPVAAATAATAGAVTATGSSAPAMSPSSSLPSVRHGDGTLTLVGAREVERTLRDLPTTAVAVYMNATDGQVSYGSLVADPTTLPSFKKASMFDEQLRSVLAVLQDRGHSPTHDITYIYSIDSAPPASASLAAHTLVYCTSSASTSPFLMRVPNVWFGPSGDRDLWRASQLLDAGRLPLHERQPVAFWRGGVDLRGPGSGPRVDMLRASVKTNKAGLSDVATTTPCREVRNASAVYGDVSSLPCGGKAVPKTSFAQYQVLLAAPGKVSASYTKALQFLWAAGAAVLRWTDESVDECREWYHDYLREGEHFAYVGPSNYSRVLRRLLGDAEQLQLMGAAARRVATDHLTFGHVVSRFRAVFAQIVRHASPTDPPRPDRISAINEAVVWCSCSLPQRQPRCTWCKEPL